MKVVAGVDVGVEVAFLDCTVEVAAEVAAEDCLFISAKTAGLSATETAEVVVAAGAEYCVVGTGAAEVVTAAAGVFIAAGWVASGEPAVTVTTTTSFSYF